MSLEKDKVSVDAQIESVTDNLRGIKNLRAHSKSTIKNKLTKIEKHTALILEELKILKSMYEKKDKR